MCTSRHESIYVLAPFLLSFRGHYLPGNDSCNFRLELFLSENAKSSDFFIYFFFVNLPLVSKAMESISALHSSS